MQKKRTFPDVTVQSVTEEGIMYDPSKRTKYLKHPITLVNNILEGVINKTEYIKNQTKLRL